MDFKIYQVTSRKPLMLICYAFVLDLLAGKMLSWRAGGFVNDNVMVNIGLIFKN